MLLDAVAVVAGEAVDVEVDGHHNDARDEEGDERGDHRVCRTEVEGAHLLVDCRALVETAAPTSAVNAGWIANKPFNARHSSDMCQADIFPKEMRSALQIFQCITSDGDCDGTAAGSAARAVPVERNGQEGDEGGREPDHGD